MSTYPSPPHPLTQPPGSYGFINLRPRTSLPSETGLRGLILLPLSQGLRMWSFSRDGLVGMQVGRKEGKPPFSHLCISSLILSSFSGAVRKLICPPGVQTHLSGRQNLFLLWGPMRALVCRSLPHARGGSPRQLPHLPSKALVEIPVPHCRLYPPPPSLFPPSPPPPLQTLRLVNSLVSSVAPLRSCPVRVHRKKFSTQARVWNFTRRCHTAPPTALHCVM